MISETAGKADVALTSMQRHVTATLTVLCQPFSSATGGSTDTDTSASSHKSSAHISSSLPQENRKPILEDTEWNTTAPEAPAGAM